MWRDKKDTPGVESVTSVVGEVCGGSVYGLSVESTRRSKETVTETNGS